MQLMTSYSRRIDRPGGRELDPFPNYMNRFMIRIGNPAIKPQYTDSYELGLMKRFDNSSFISAEAFYKVTNDLISRVQELRDDDIIYMTYENLNQDYSFGSEVMANINATKWLLLNGSFSVYRYRIEGELDGESIDRSSTNYNGRLNTTVKFSPDSRLQFTSFYRGPSVSAQGENSGMLFSNLSYRHEFMNKKLSAVISLRDVFGTMKFESESFGNDFQSKFRMNRESQILTLTLSYKINNYKMDNGGGDGTREMDFDGGGDF
jgi:outer membrane receptor protein involved in Fe transport